MLSEQKNYDFKKELLVIHKPDIRDYTKMSDGEFDFSDGVSILIENPKNEVIMTAVKDFCDYLFTSQHCSATLVRKGNYNVLVKFSNDLIEGNGYMGYRITISADNIIIEGHDDRGIAQAFYYLEDLMNIKIG